MKRFVTFIFLIISSSLYAEYSDTFVINIFPQVIKVTSPEKRQNKLSLIVNNKSMIKVYGKVVSKDGNFVQSVNIKPNDFDSVELDLKNHKKFFFIPLSPPYDEILLEIGKKAYEIPAKE